MPVAPSLQCAGQHLFMYDSVQSDVGESRLHCFDFLKENKGLVCAFPASSGARLRIFHSEVSCQVLHLSGKWHFVGKREPGQKLPDRASPFSQGRGSDLSQEVRGCLHSCPTVLPSACLYSFVANPRFQPICFVCVSARCRSIVVRMLPLRPEASGSRLCREEKLVLSQLLLCNFVPLLFFSQTQPDSRRHVVHLRTESQ